MANKGRSVRDALRVSPDEVDLERIDPVAMPTGPKSKSEATAALTATGAELDDLQEALYAEGVTGGRRRVLLVLQGMDTSGKGGTISHVAGHMNPQGLHVVSFKKPTEEERRHHFLWRIRHQVPKPGYIGVFDRSHYEDVLVPRVEKLIPTDELEHRYQEINDFEDDLVHDGVTIVKCFLHISPEVQKKRLLARLENPKKWWKYSPGDIDVRAKWSQYQAAYAEALRRCSTTAAPWYAVPSDRKWYRNWAVGRLLLETMRELRPVYPPPSFDPEAEKARLLEADPLS